MNTDIISYYKERANEYEKIYSKPERQADLKTTSLFLKGFFRNKNVYEIACGTGYWTERIAEAASSVIATDINEEVIAIAREKEYENNNVTFEVSDFYKTPITKKNDTLFGGFICSHILKQDFDHFVNTVNQFVKPGGWVVLMDNNFVEGSNHPIAKTDTAGNTYQERFLENGSKHLVLKNFLTESYLREKLKNKSSEIYFISYDYFWILKYKT